MKPLRLTMARTLAGSLPPLIAARGAHWIYPADRAWHDAYQFRLRARTGSFYTGDTRDVHARACAIYGYFDWRLLAAARYFCKSGETIVEVGANVGTETIGLADIVGRRGRVYAFEPEPSNATQLRRAMSSAGLSQVEVIDKAVSDRVGHVTFVPGPDRESGSGHIGTGDGPGDDGSLRVDCLTLDSFFADKGPVRLLVMDAEGAEVGIVRGGGQLLRRDQPVVIVEARDEHLRRFGADLATLEAELRAHGYQVYELARLGLTPASADQNQHTGRRTVFETPAKWGRNWLALPPALADQAGRAHRHLLWCGLVPCIRGLNPLAKRLA